MKLYIQQRFFSIGDKYNVYDARENPVYTVEGAVFSIGAKIRLYDRNNRELYYIEREVFSLLPVYRVYQKGQLMAEIQQEFAFFTRNLTIHSVHGQYTLNGDFLGMDFTILRNGRPVGTIAKEWFRLTDCYELDVADDVDPAFFATMVIAIDNCLHEKN